MKISTQLSLVVKAACALGACGILSIAHADAPPAEIHIAGERPVPESLTSDKNGTVYIGSIVARTIYRALPGADKAEPWIGPEAEGMQNVLGVLADDASKTLWACSSPNAAQPGEPPPQQSALYAFDLKSGALKGKYPFPTPGAVCNDIDVARDGTAYATDTSNMQVVRLKKGAKDLEVWSADGVFGEKGGVLDGIAILGNTLYANTLNTSKLFAVAIERDGKAGATIEVQLDRALERPDGMRSFGKNSILIVEGGGPGRLSKVVIDGGSGKVTTLKEGFADNAVAVTVVGQTGYVLEAQFKARRDPAYVPKPFKATAVPVGKP